MKSKRLIAGIILSGLALLVVAGQPAWAQPKPVVIKVANAGPNVPDNRTVIALDMFKRMVEGQTRGVLEVRAYHASSLGSEREALEGIKIGTIEMGTLSAGTVPGFFAPAMVYDIPYLFSSAPLAWEVFNGTFGRDFFTRIHFAIPAAAPRQAAGLHRFPGGGQPVLQPHIPVRLDRRRDHHVGGGLPPGRVPVFHQNSPSLV